eukprot:SAG22_NODE_790_length_7216_cov_5.198820_3_plen_81_part_00
MEVKVVEGHGTTIDVLLVNGEITSGDTIVVCGLNGPIVTQIRALMTTAPMQVPRASVIYAAVCRPLPLLFRSLLCANMST